MNRSLCICFAKNIHQALVRRDGPLRPAIHEEGGDGNGRKDLRPLCMPALFAVIAGDLRCAVPKDLMALFHPVISIPMV